MTGAYYQSATRNLTMIVLCVLAAGFFSWRYFDGNGSFLNIIYMVCAAAGGLHGGWGFIQKEPAISFDKSGIKLRRWLGTAEIPWRDVHDVTTKVVTIRGTEIKWLSVACEGGMLGSRTVNVSLSSLDIATGCEEMVAAAVRQAWIAAVGEAGAVMAGAGQKGWGANFYERTEPDSDFDADAAFARYQAKQSRVAEDYVPAPSPAPTPQHVSSANAPRPVFGRKAI